MTYSQLLVHLDLNSLHHRRLAKYMVFLFKIKTGETNMDMNCHLQIREPGITCTRGHSLRNNMPAVKHVVTKRCFLSRVAEPWNKMPSKLLDCRSADSYRPTLLTHIADPYISIFVNRYMMYYSSGLPRGCQTCWLALPCCNCFTHF